MQTRCWRGDPVYKAIPRGCKVLVYFADIAQHSTYSKRSACFMFYPSPLATARCGLCQLSLEWPLINTKLWALMSFWVGVCVYVCVPAPSINTLWHVVAILIEEHCYWLFVCVCVCVYSTLCECAHKKLFYWCLQQSKKVQKFATFSHL